MGGYWAGLYAGREQAKAGNGLLKQHQVALLVFRKNFLTPPKWFLIVYNQQGARSGWVVFGNMTAVAKKGRDP